MNNYIALEFLTKHTYFMHSAVYTRPEVQSVYPGRTELKRIEIQSTFLDSEHGVEV